MLPGLAFIAFDDSTIYSFYRAAGWKYEDKQLAYRILVLKVIPMIALPGRQRRYFSVRLIIGSLQLVLLLILGGMGCDIIKGKPSVITDVENKVKQELGKESKSEPEPGPEEYITIKETDTFKVIAVLPHADLQAIGKQLAQEAKDKPVLSVDVYDNEEEARNYGVRYDSSITPEDAALEDNEEALVAIYRKDAKTGQNYIEIYNDISHEEVEIIRF